VPTPRYRLLVADPDRLQLQLIDMLLATGEYDLALVESGRDALEFLRGHSPDLCLLALDLPDVAGDVICGKVRRVTRLARTPVILIAPQDEKQRLADRDRARARKAGADLILPRPLGDKNLRERVQELLDAREETPTREGFTTQIIEEALVDLTEEGGGEAAEQVAAAEVGEGDAGASEEALRLPDDDATGAAERSDAPQAPAESPRPRSSSGAGGAGGGAGTNTGPGDAGGARGAGGAPRGSQGHERGRDDSYGAIQRELQSLRMENAQLRRKLREKDEALESGVNPKLNQRITELERRNQALLDRIEELEEGGGRGGGLFGRRR
jgi:CheY-like chemotaxis protein